MMERTINAILNDVAELPDRTSPEDWPDAMLVTADELRAILQKHLSWSADANSMVTVNPAPHAAAPAISAHNTRILDIR